MKNKKYLILSFLIPFSIYIFFFYINGFLTDKMILIGDSRLQYYPLLHYLKGILNGSNSLFYSFSKSVGGAMFGTFFYYLSSPFNLLVHFISEKNILDFMTYLIIIKLSLCGLTMYIYMSQKFKKKSYMILIFSILYSVSGYNLNYFLNIMWLDVILLAPLVLLGLDKIIENKSPLIYIITLTLSIYSNYYLAYMVCIFCVLYFIYEILLKHNFKENKKEIINILKKFIISSLLSGLICSFFLIPCIIEMLEYGRGATLDNILTFDYNIFNLLANTYIAAFDTTHPFNTYSINLYSGIIIFPLIYLYFLNKDITKKEKILTSSLIIFMLLPCFLGPLNCFWHLFSTPFGYNYRFSFLLILVLIRIAYKSYTNFKINKIDILQYLAVYISYSVIILLIGHLKVGYYENLQYYKIWISNILLIIYFVILYSFKNKKHLNKLIFALIFIEIIINIGIVFNNKDFQSRMYLGYDYSLMEDIDTNKRITIQNEEMNATLINKKLGLNYFLTTQNSSTFKLHQISQNSNLTATNKFTVPDYETNIFNALFANEYIVSDKEYENYIKVKQININNQNFALYQNPNALEIGYIIENECNNLEFEFPYDQKTLNCLLSENNEFYKEIPYSIKNHTITFESNKYYIINTEITKKSYKYFKELLGNRIIDSGNYSMLVESNSNIVNLKISDEYINNIKLYSFDYELFENKIQKLKNTNLDYNANKNIFTATINSKGGLLMLTIPFEKGMKAYLNDEEIKIQKVMDNFIGLNIPKGTNQIKLVYKTPYLIPSFIISLITLIISIIYIRKNNISK